MRGDGHVSNNALRLRTVLQNYGDQLVLARRVRQSKGHTALGLEAQEAEPSDTARAAMVERVARELIENLLVAGARTPLVDEITMELEKEFDTRFFFEYPLLECDLQVYRRTDNGPVRLSEDERSMVLGKLWEITLGKVDKTML